MTSISIIMPCYNAGLYVKDAIESVLSQTVPVQLLVVDDGSTDNTREILDRYSADILILQSDHLGVAHARNKAIPYVNGRYCLLLDSDDVLAPNSLRYLLHQAGQYDNEIVYGNFSSWDSVMRKKILLHRVMKLGESPISVLAKRNISPPGAILFPSDAFAKVGGFDQAVAGCEDWDFVIRLARAGYGFRRLNREVFFYRRLFSSASNQPVKMLEAGIEVIRRCHSSDVRVCNDRYVEGYRPQDVHRNIFSYYAACLALAIFSPDKQAAREILERIIVPDDPDWGEFGESFRVSVRWNSLPVTGERRQIIFQAQLKCALLIKHFANHHEWMESMMDSILYPNIRELSRRPAPRLFNDWRVASKIHKIVKNL